MGTVLFQWRWGKEGTNEVDKMKGTYGGEEEGSMVEREGTNRNLCMTIPVFVL